MKRHYLPKYFLQCALTLIEISLVGLLVVWMLGVYSPTDDLAVKVERFFIGSATYEAIVFMILSQINDISRDSHVAILSLYKEARHYLKCKDEKVKKAILKSINMMVENDVFLTKDVVEYIKQIPYLIEEQKEDFIEWNIILLEHQCTLDDLKWRHSFLLRLVK